MTRYLYILLFVLVNSPALAQTQNTLQQEKKNGIQLSVGAVHTRMINRGYTHSNVLFIGTNSRFDLNYSRDSPQSRFRFSASASVGKMYSKSGRLPSELVSMYPAVSYARKVKAYRFAGKPGAFFAGIQLSSINYYLENEPVIDNIDIFSLHGLYLNLQKSLTLNEKQSLQLSYNMPLVVYANRVLWNGGASDITYEDRERLFKTLLTRGRFSYVDLAGNAEVRIDYVFRAGKNTDFELKYRFFYLNGFKEAPVHLYSNELLFGLTLKF